MNELAVGAKVGDEIPLLTVRSLLFVVPEASVEDQVVADTGARNGRRIGAGPVSGGAPVVIATEAGRVGSRFMERRVNGKETGGSDATTSLFMGMGKAAR